MPSPVCKIIVLRKNTYMYPLRVIDSTCNALGFGVRMMQGFSIHPSCQYSMSCHHACRRSGLRRRRGIPARTSAKELNHIQVRMNRNKYEYDCVRC